MSDHPATSVLLVQPECDDRDMYAEFLRYQGFLPVPASTAVHALSIAPAVDIVVTGIRLPGHLDGIALVDRLKRDRQTKSTPVLVLTASAGQSDRDRAIAAGCDTFLVKPCLPDRLVREIRRLLVLSHVPKPQPASIAAHARTSQRAPGRRRLMGG
jgi:two-component system, cell cycle response regulator DivK